MLVGQTKISKNPFILEVLRFLTPTVRKKDFPVSWKVPENRRVIKRNLKGLLFHIASHVHEIMQATLTGDV